MSVTRTPEERDGISTQSEHNGPTKKPSNVICFACRKKITAGENHTHPYSNGETQSQPIIRAGGGQCGEEKYLELHGLGRGVDGVALQINRTANSPPDQAGRRGWRARGPKLTPPADKPRPA